MMNGKVNHGYVPDSAVTTASGVHWTKDRRNGGTVQTPPDNDESSQPNGEGPLRTQTKETLQNTALKYRNSKSSRRKSLSARVRLKSSVHSERSPDHMEVGDERDPKERIEKSEVVGECGGFAMTLNSMTAHSTSSVPSGKSQVSLRHSNNEGCSSLDSDVGPDDSRPIFTVDEEMSNNPMFPNLFLSPHRASADNISLQRRNRRKRNEAYDRPSSSVSVLRENTMRGPTYHYKAKETYFDCEFYIYGHKYQKDEREMLAPGVYEFPFAFNLPPNLPPSFASEKGVIRYVVAAILDRPAAANLVRKKAFNLLSVLDLNMDSHAASNMRRSKTMNLCGLFCHTGPITLSVSIPKRAFVPGEKIIVHAEADNISGRSTKRTRLMLLQLITYIMPNKLKTHVEQRVVKEVVRGIIPPGESDIWDGVALLVPPLSPCNIHISGRLIKVDYCVEMVLELPLPWKHLRVTLPITIGSVPLRSDFKSFMPPPLTIEKQRPLPKINYPEFPLYSFSECFFGRETMEAQYERLTGDVDDIGPQYEPLHPFAPSYITYTLGKMVDASQLKDIDTRPSTADQRRRSSDRASVSKGSKNGSVGSKASRGSKSSRDSKGSRGSKGSDGNKKRELDSKEQLTMSVINKISSESLKIRSEWLKNRRQADKEQDTSGTVATDGTHTSSPAADASEAHEKALEVAEDYDFDKEDLKKQSVSSQCSRRKVSGGTKTKFKATKIISKSKFNSPKDFVADDYSLTTP